MKEETVLDKIWNVSRLRREIKQLVGMAMTLEDAATSLNDALGLLQIDLLDLETEPPCYVYYIMNEYRDLVKIGISSDPVRRAKGMQTATGDELEILKTIRFKDREEAWRAEQHLHNVFGEFRKKPTKVSKTTEWFDAAIVKKLISEYDTAEKILADAEQFEKLVRTEMERCNGLYDN